MTVTDLDPPRPHLRLITNSAGPHRRESRRYRDAAALSSRARAVHRLTVRFALAQGRSIDPDALRVVLATLQSHLKPVDRLVADQIWGLMFVDIVAWCRARQLPLPDRCGEALGLMIDALASERQLAHGSDPVPELHSALSECTGDWDHDDDRPDPIARARSVRSSRGKRS